MKKDHFTDLKNIIMFAFQTETHYYTYPYSQDLHIPSEIMNIMCPNFLNTDSRIIPSHTSPNRRLFVIKTNLDFYSIIFYLDTTAKPDIISIGPFRSNDTSLDMFLQKINFLLLSSDNYTYLKNFYTMLPAVSLQNIVNTATYLINTYFITDEEDLFPIRVDFARFDYYESDFIKEEFDSPYFIPEPLIIQTKETLCQLVDAITRGETETAQYCMKHFLTQTNVLFFSDIAQTKRGVHTINDYIQMSFLNTHIHPMQTAKLNTFFIKKIENAANRDDLAKLTQEMCQRYCNLCQNNTFPEYSKTINNVINYIHSHIQEPLTLASIANHFNKNPSALSSSFTQNTGMNITNYIHKVRINRAIDYFNATDLSISEVSLAVGYDNFAYFSRLFRKHVGCSPKEYRHSH